MASNFESKAFNTEFFLDVRPTLYIALGGSGADVLLNLRSKILSNLWGEPDTKIQMHYASEFSLAEFFYLQPNPYLSEHDRRNVTDGSMSSMLEFNYNDSIVEYLNFYREHVSTYELQKSSYLNEWLPFQRRELSYLDAVLKVNVDQIRAVSRLFFFAEYSRISNRIIFKLKELQNALKDDVKKHKLGVKVKSDEVRIVVVASIAEASASGVFLDMGWLANYAAEKVGIQANVDLVLLMSSDSDETNKSLVEANSYAALMELETAMTGNKAFVSPWSNYDKPRLKAKPYSDVYLIDTLNSSGEHIENVRDTYSILVNNLFEDLVSSGDFASRKREVSANQAYHKNNLQKVFIPNTKVADMHLSYSKCYSSFGHSVLGVKLDAEREQHVYLWSAEMLKTFFGLESNDVVARHATSQQCDDFLALNASLSIYVFNDFPTFSDRPINLEYSSLEFNDYTIVQDLLSDKNGSLVTEVTERISQMIDLIKTVPLELRASQVRIALNELERFATPNLDLMAETCSIRLKKRRMELLALSKEKIQHQLYSYLDNKGAGGLGYTMSLIDQIQEKIQDRNDGLIARLHINEKRYKKIRESLRSREFEPLINQLEKMHGFSSFGNNERQSLLTLEKLRSAMSNIIKFHLLAIAAKKAATYLGELSSWLGKKTGPYSGGLASVFFTGCQEVNQMIKTLEQSKDILQLNLQKKQANLFYVHTPEFQVPMPNPIQLCEWANHALIELCGSSPILQILSDQKQKKLILSKLLTMARRQVLACTSIASGICGEDNLIKALELMTKAARAELIRSWVSNSMPLININLSSGLHLNADQYRCMIAVSNVEEFSQKFGEEIKASLPTQAGITADQLIFVNSSVAGSAVCYTELSGIALSTLIKIESWRSNYNLISKNIPLHTHIDSSQFNHIVVPNTHEVEHLVRDLLDKEDSPPPLPRLRSKIQPPPLIPNTISSETQLLPSFNIVEALQNVSSLRESGILTQAEFDALKAELLKKLVS